MDMVEDQVAEEVQDRLQGKLSALALPWQRQGRATPLPVSRRSFIFSRYAGTNLRSSNDA
jgi:hypothetical protein